MTYSSTKWPVKAFILTDFFLIGAELEIPSLLPVTREPQALLFSFSFLRSQFSVLLEENQYYLDENMRLYLIFC